MFMEWMGRAQPHSFAAIRHFRPEALLGVPQKALGSAHPGMASRNQE